ncbi:CehA/McbA family metallohydrolase [Deinococcus koreensis]|uniref:PHP-like protein n=1 Tax=Deinococcus koreensis TaxID=2054903 RepID=A0A2K3UXR1_9DEIO|nr:CehA/McbA family metallohydrolase [Deinococcus koreensis]PNY81319.1 PHP-like protein [Deinococcus koreensis]
MITVPTGEDLMLDVEGQVSPHPRVHYLHHEFEVPAGVSGLSVTLQFHKERQCQLFLSLFGPAGYRGTRMNPGALGDVVLELELGAGSASPGALPGQIEAGLWRAQIDVEYTEETTEYRLTARAQAGGPEAKTPQAETEVAPRRASTNGRPGAGWYRGELHAHTHHSDGKVSVSALAGAARRYGLDFLALTDHFTVAGWPELEAEAGSDLAVLRSTELTGHRGHANLHGLSAWVDPFVDDPDRAWDINAVAHEVHAQGGLFGVNHAFSNRLGWRYHEFDWSLCDVFEIYHHLEGANNAAQLSFWDGLLRAGHRITGVAGTDSHDPHAGRHRLGQVVTVLGAADLDPPGLIGALKAGRAYVSLGPGLRFSAEADSLRVEMGGTLPVSDTVTLHVGLAGLAFPVRVFVIKNGLYHAHLDLGAGEANTELEFTDSQPVPGYYRIEVYARPAQSEFSGGRDWQNTLLLSNPIYIGERP